VKEFSEQESVVEEVTWRKSSWSAFNGNCVEVGSNGDGLIHVRDTKDVGEGRELSFGDDEWRKFLKDLKQHDDTGSTVKQRGDWGLAS
jgi:hypothetical protein